MWILVLLICLIHLAFQTLLIWYVYKDVDEQVVVTTLPAPNKPSILLISEVSMEQFLYKLGLPAVEAHDVVKRELCVSINGADPIIHEIVDVNLDVYELTFEQDTHVSIYLIDIDDAGNRSAKGAVCEFTVIDTIPPAAPAAPVVMDVIEVAPVVTEPVVEDVVEEPVVEEPPAEGEVL